MVKWHEGIRDYRGLRLCRDCWDNRHYRWLKDKDSKSKGKGKKVSACTGCECPCKELLIQQSAPNPRILAGSPSRGPYCASCGHPSYAHPTTFQVGDIVDGWPGGIEGQAVITGSETAKALCNAKDIETTVAAGASLPTTRRWDDLLERKTRLDPHD